MKYYIPVFVCSILIFWLSVTSGANLPETLKDLFSLDKLGHATAYGILTFLWFRAIDKSKKQIDSRQMVKVSLWVALYGISLEIIQYCFFPARHFEVLDILANIMGIVIVNLIFKQLINKNSAA